MIPVKTRFASNYSIDYLIGVIKRKYATWKALARKQDKLSQSQLDAINILSSSGTIEASKIPNLDASKITTGVIDIDRLPQGALERLVTVANQTARFALTSTDVQLGDTVKQTDTGVMYIVTDTANLGNNNGYTEYTAGSATSVPWSGVTGKPAFANVATSGSYNDLTDKPTIPTVPTNYVTTDTTQTVSGQKTWTAINTFSGGQLKLKSSGQEIGVTPANNTIQYFEFNDKNNEQHGVIGLWDYNNGASEIQMYIADKFKNGAKDPTGTSESSFLSFGFKADGNKFLTFSGQVDNSIIPKSNNTYDLGTSVNKWNVLYSQNVSTNLVENPGSDGLLIRSTDQTWENGARIFLYSNTHTGQTNGSIYIDVDHGDENNTKTALSLVPYALHPLGGGTNGVSLGTSTDQWSSVYAQTYYYGGTEFSDKFWTADTVQSFTVSKHLRAYNLKVGQGETYGRTGYTLAWTDKDDVLVGYIDSFKNSHAARTVLRIRAGDYYTNGTPDSEGTQVLAGLRVGTLADSTRVIEAEADAVYPATNNATDLGTSSNKWKTLNGISPGALSIPNLASAIDIASSITNTAGGDNFYTAPTDGLVSVVILGTSNLMVFAPSSNRFYYGTQSMTPDNEGNTWCSIPVPTGYRVRIRVNGTILGAAFYPNLGNV